MAPYCTSESMQPCEHTPLAPSSTASASEPHELTTNLIAAVPLWTCHTGTRFVGHPSQKKNFVGKSNLLDGSAYRLEASVVCDLVHPAYRSTAWNTRRPGWPMPDAVVIGHRWHTGTQACRRQVLAAGLDVTGGSHASGCQSGCRDATPEPSRCT